MSTVNITNIANLFARDDFVVENVLRTLRLDSLIQGLSAVRSMNETEVHNYLLASNIALSQSPKILARQILNESDFLLDQSNSGEIAIGKGTFANRFEFFFEKGEATGLRKIYVPYFLSPQVSKSYNFLKRVVKVSFINLKSLGYPLLTVPLGILTLGGYLKRVFGEQVLIDYVDMQIEDHFDIIEYINSSTPDIIGISAMVGTTSGLFETLKNLSETRVSRKPFIVLGNVVPTYASDEILRSFPDVVCVIGRGENFIKELVEMVANDPLEIDLFRTPNSSFRIGCTIYETGGVNFDLNELGLPDWERLFKKYPPQVYQEVWIEGSRGCPQKKGGIGCSFCAIMPNNSSRDWVARPLEAVEDEIKLLSKHNVPHIRFADEEFMAGQTVNALDLAKRLLRLKESLFNLNLKMPTFDFAIRVDDVHKRGAKEEVKFWDSGDRVLLSNNELRRIALRTFKEAGLIQIYLGLESGSASQLKRMYKAVLPRDNEMAIRTLREIGIQIAGGWIMIDPLMDGLDDLKENIAFLEENNLIPSSMTDDFVTNPINRMRVLDGSPLVDTLRRHGLLRKRTSTLIEFEFIYKDPLIASIVGILDMWDKRIKPFLYALKNQVAVNALNVELLYDSRYLLLSSYLFQLKRLDFDYLKEIVNLCDNIGLYNLKDRTLLEMSANYDKEREKLIQMFVHDLDIGLLCDDSGTISEGLRLLYKGVNH